jgi:phosphoglycerate dehydrogenase-like enzyme
MMKSDAIIINVGRGNAIDADALYEAVSQGKLWGAALDVTAIEPLPKDSPLWRGENIIITPHITGFFHLRDTYDMIIEIAAENLRRYSAGEKLLNRVDKNTRYRANGDEGFSREKHHKN